MKILQHFFPTVLLFNCLTGEDKDFDSLRNVQFSFRNGFPDRVTARLENLLEEKNSPEILKGVSFYLPKLSIACVTVLAIFGIILLYVNGGFDSNALFGTEIINESNFLSYLILEK